MVEHAPVLYQELASGRRDVAGSFVLQGTGQVTFAVGAYDPSQPLVIDPVLSYSTFFGGAAFETGYSVAVDASGNAYVAGDGARAPRLPVRVPRGYSHVSATGSQRPGESWSNVAQRGGGWSICPVPRESCTCGART